jgi:predicted kinase
MTEATYAELFNRADDRLQKGCSVIMDACFIGRHQRSRFAELARRRNVPFVILQVACSETEIRRRLVEREAGRKSVSDGRVELLASQASEYEVPDATEGMLINLSANLPPHILADEIYARLTP